MANSSILAAFERMWQHITIKLADKADTEYVDTEVESAIDSLPFETVGNNDTLTWNGDTDGLYNPSGTPFYHVSDAIPTVADLQKGGTFVLNGNEMSFTSENIIDGNALGIGNGAFISIDGNEVVGVLFEAGATIAMGSTSITLEKAGVYFLKQKINDAETYIVTSLSINDYTGFAKSVLSKEALPNHSHSWDNVAEDVTYGDTLTWDGNTEGLYSIMDMLYQVSDIVPTLEDFQNGGTLATHGGEVLEFTSENVLDAESMEMGSNLIMINTDAVGIFIALKDGASLTTEDTTVIFEKTGIYYPHYGETYCVSLTINGYNGFETIEATPVPIKYLEPFETVEAGSDTLEWDGKTEDRDNWNGFYHVSEAVLTVEDIVNGSTLTVTSLETGQVYSFGIGEDKEFQCVDVSAAFGVEAYALCMLSPSNMYVGILPNGAELNGDKFKKGIYFGILEVDGEQGYVSSLTINGYTGFTKEHTEIKKEYLPEHLQFGGNATISDTITWDGNTDGLTNVMGMAYHVSSATPTLEDLQNGGTIVVTSNGTPTSYSFTSEHIVDVESMGAGENLILVQCDGGMIVVALEDGGYLSEGGMNISFPKKGIYFIGVDDDGNGVFNYISSFTINDYKFTISNIKYVDNKYINLEWNDIKKVPFYKQEDAVMLSQITLTQKYEGNIFVEMIAFPDLTVGEIYTVVYNGVSYECEALEFDDTIFLGNPKFDSKAYEKYGFSTSAPFMIFSYYGYLAVGVDDANTTSVTIEILGTKIKQLDTDLLPLDWIPAKVPVKTFYSDWNIDSIRDLYRDNIYKTDKSSYNICFDRKEDERVDIEFDDVYYSCRCKIYNGLVFIGNASLYDNSYPDTGEPFLFATDSDNSNSYDIYFVGDNVHYIKAWEYIESESTIPHKYLPEDLGKLVSWNDIQDKICDVTTEETETVLFENIAFDSSNATYTESTTSSGKIQRIYRIDFPEEYKGKLPLREADDCKYRFVVENAQVIPSIDTASPAFGNNPGKTLGSIKPTGCSENVCIYEEDSNIGSLYIRYIVSYAEGETCTDPVFNFTMSLYEIITKKMYSTLDYGYISQEVKSLTEEVKSNTIYWNGEYEGAPYVTYGDKTYVRIPQKYVSVNTNVYGRPDRSLAFGYTFKLANYVKYGNKTIEIRGLSVTNTDTVITDGEYVFFVRSDGAQYTINDRVITFPERGLYLLRNSDTYVSEFTTAHSQSKFYVRRPIYNHDDVHMDKKNPVGTGSFSLNRKADTTIGTNSVAIGFNATASEYCSHAEGSETIAASRFQHVQGVYNIEDTEDKYVHIVGNGTLIANKDGTTTAVRSNAHTLDWDGNAWFAGSVEGTALILLSPNGTRFNITVGDDGVLSATEITE